MSGAGGDPADRVIRESIAAGRAAPPEATEQILERMATALFERQETPVRSLARIDRYLDLLVAEWLDIPKLAAEWPTWERHARLDFVHEWPIQEDRLAQLRDCAGRGLLTPPQRARYETLLRLVEQHRPTLATLLEG